MNGPKKVEIACRYGLLHGAFLSRRRFGRECGRFSSLPGSVCVCVCVCVNLRNPESDRIGWYLQGLACFILFPGSHLG